MRSLQFPVVYQWCKKQNSRNYNISIVVPLSALFVLEVLKVADAYIAFSKTMEHSLLCCKALDLRLSRSQHQDSLKSIIYWATMMLDISTCRIKGHRYSPIAAEIQSVLLILDAKLILEFPTSWSPVIILWPWSLWSMVKGCVNVWHWCKTYKSLAHSPHDTFRSN